MKKFEIRVTQELSGYYEGTIVIEASNKQSALNKLEKMPKKEIDEQADWTNTDHYDGDYNTIRIDSEKINEI